MRRFFLLLLVSAFVANTYVAAAWAVPCVRDMGAPAKAATADAPMPCHAAAQQAQSAAAQDQPQKQQEIPGKHCKGLCLCMHAVSSAAADFRDVVMAWPPLAGADIPQAAHGLLSSIDGMQFFRPPRSLP